MKSTSVANCATSQVNSRKSTSAVTEARKARMRNNALRHGLTSKHVVIEGGAWRLMRARRVETQIFEDQRGESGAGDDTDSRTAECFEFDNLRRYETKIERTYYRALSELRKLQNETRKSAVGSVSQNAMQLSVHFVFSMLKISPKNGLTQ